jgi:hypothetical protein
MEKYLISFLSAAMVVPKASARRWLAGSTRSPECGIEWRRSGAQQFI